MTSVARSRVPLGALAGVIALRAAAALAASVLVVGPLARQLRSTPGGETTLLADGALRLADLVLGVGRFAVLPPDGSLGVIAAMLVAVEILAVAVLFAATHARGPVLAETGRILPRFVLVAGAKAIVTVVVMGALVAVLPSPETTWLSSRFGVVALVLYVAGMLAVLGVLRVVFDVARSASVPEGRSLAEVARVTARVVLERPGYLVVRLVLVELGRGLLFAAALAIGAALLLRRLDGGGASGVVLGAISQQASIAIACVLDVVWVRFVRDVVHRP